MPPGRTMCAATAGREYRRIRTLTGSGPSRLRRTLGCEEDKRHPTLGLSHRETLEGEGIGPAPPVPALLTRPLESSIAERVLSALAEVTELDEVRTTPDFRLFEGHVLDSVRTVELILLLSDRLGVDISPAEFDPDLWATPAKMVQYFETRMT